eukprot:228498_1
MVFAIDMITFTKYKNTNNSNTGWDNYNCYAQILFNSSNLKRVWSFFIIVYGGLQVHIVDDYDDINEQIASVNAPTNITSTPNIYKSKITKQLIQSLAIIIALYILICLPVFITHYVAGIFAYCWICISLYCCFICAGGCGLIIAECFHCPVCTKIFGCDFMLEIPNSTDR